MRNLLLSISLFIFALSGLCAQDKSHAFTVHTWVDAFGSSQGIITYPQYGWKANTSVGTFSGFGFLESTPQERMFDNNIVVYTPPKLKWFSIHSEAGGYPAHHLGFYQFGPQVNLVEVVPKLKKPMTKLSVSAIPRFIGIRPNNLMVAWATNPAKFKNATVWCEGYRRFFPPSKPATGEYWLLVKPTTTSHVSFGVIGHENGNKNYAGFGLRISFF